MEYSPQLTIHLKRTLSQYRKGAGGNSYSHFSLPPSVINSMGLAIRESYVVLNVSGTHKSPYLVIRKSSTVDVEGQAEVHHLQRGGRIDLSSGYTAAMDSAVGYKAASIVEIGDRAVFLATASLVQKTGEQILSSNAEFPADILGSIALSGLTESTMSNFCADSIVTQANSSMYKVMTSLFPELHPR